MFCQTEDRCAVGPAEGRMGGGMRCPINPEMGIRTAGSLLGFNGSGPGARKAHGDA